MDRKLEREMDVRDTNRERKRDIWMKEKIIEKEREKDGRKSRVMGIWEFQHGRESSFAF